MNELFGAPLGSPLLLVLSVAYVIFKAITTYDVRLNQAHTAGFISGVAAASGGRVLPSWVGVFIWAEWSIFIALLILNWKFAIVLWVVTFILKVLPVLEYVGSILMRPFLRAGPR